MNSLWPVVAFVGGVLLATLTLVVFIWPKKEARLIAEAGAKDRADRLKNDIAEAKRLRDDELKKKLDAIEDKKEAELARDPVDVANELIERAR